MPTYRELLLDPRWQKVRLKKLEAAEWMCQCCHDSETTLSVHHKRYVKGRMPWEYTDGELVVLCQPCHEMEHEAKDLRSEVLGRLDIDGPVGIEDFFAYGSGAVRAWATDPALVAALEQIRDTKPFQFAAGQFVTAFSDIGLRAHAFEVMLVLLGPDSDGQFAEDIRSVLLKHGVPLVDSAQGSLRQPQ